MADRAAGTSAGSVTSPHHRLPAALLCLWLTAGPQIPNAQDLAPGQLRRLVRRAASHPNALAAIRRAESVGGHPVDFRALLSGARGEAATARLRALADGLATGEPGPDPRRARDDARRLLAARAFRPEVLPRPFAGALRRLGVWLTPLWRRVVAALNWAAGRVPGGRATLWAILAGVVVGGAVLVVGMVARRPHAHTRGRPESQRGPAAPGPAQLERRAEEAEASGDAERAVRLRFRAGLLRLAAAGIITPHPSITAGEVRRRLGSDAFESLCGAFEEIVYGGRRATPEDAASARAWWDEVHREVKA